MELPFLIKSFLPPEALAELEKLDIKQVGAKLADAAARVERVEIRTQTAAEDIGAMRAELAELRADVGRVLQQVGAILQAQPQAVNHG